MHMASYSLSMDKQNYIIHPQKFALWLFILSVIMIFGGLTSAYIVSRGAVPADQLILFDLPSILWYNLGVMLVSSVTMQISVWLVKREESNKALISLGMTFVLGCIFLVGQWDAFQELTTSGLPFVDQNRMDDSISYFYVVTGLHGLHIVSALIAVLIVLLQTALQQFRDPARRSLVFDMAAIFWHFLGLLWVYLFIFLKYTQN
jgi:cytochrome c oxidase subunit III